MIDFTQRVREAIHKIIQYVIQYEHRWKKKTVYNRNRNRILLFSVSNVYKSISQRASSLQVLYHTPGEGMGRSLMIGVKTWNVAPSGRGVDSLTTFPGNSKMSPSRCLGTYLTHTRKAQPLKSMVENHWFTKPQTWISYGRHIYRSSCEPYAVTPGLQWRLRLISSSPVLQVRVLIFCTKQHRHADLGVDLRQVTLEVPFSSVYSIIPKGTRLKSLRSFGMLKKRKCWIHLASTPSLHRCQIIARLLRSPLHRTLLSRR
jgi:hypothetical protein